MNELVASGPTRAAAGHPTVDSRTLAGGARRLLAAATRSRWRGGDPYDGLSRPWPRVMRNGRRRRQAIVQLYARSPVDIRRLDRRSPPVIAKALGTFGLAAAHLYAQHGAATDRSTALDALALLDEDRSAGPDAWGYPWDVQTRWSFYPAHSPNVIVTAFAGAGLESAETLGVDRFRPRARRAAEWTAQRLYRDGYFAYHEGSDALVHNASLLGARLVHALMGDDPVARTMVSRAVERTLAAQRRDGSWPYGNGPGLGWVDGFHTGYVLACLCSLRDLDPAIEGALARGASYYLQRCFDREGRALLYPARRYPEDGHSAGTGLTALSALVSAGLIDREALVPVARRTLTHVLRGDHAVFRRYRFGAASVHYIRWCDAHVALGLADASRALA